MGYAEEDCLNPIRSNKKTELNALLGLLLINIFLLELGNPRRMYSSTEYITPRIYLSNFSKYLIEK
jgi:hypothetical protein